MFIKWLPYKRVVVRQIHKWDELFIVNDFIDSNGKVCIQKVWVRTDPSERMHRKLYIFNQQNRSYVVCHIERIRDYVPLKAGSVWTIVDFTQFHRYSIEWNRWIWCMHETEHLVLPRECHISIVVSIIGRLVSCFANFWIGSLSLCFVLSRWVSGSFHSLMIER